MHKIFGYTVYMDEGILFFYVLLYAPIAASVVAIIHNLARRYISSPYARRAVLGPLVAVVLTFPFWDVASTAVRLKPLCEDEAGVKVYRTVHADGLRDWTLNQLLISKGFKFTEGDGPGGHKYRWTARDGQIVEERIEDFTTRYGYGSRPDVQISQQIRRHGMAVIDEVNQEILGEEVYFAIWPGWFQFFVARMFGAEIGPQFCGRGDPHDLLFQTVIPTRS